MGRRKEKHHLETSPKGTFRVVEEEEEAEELLDTVEDPTNPRIGEGERTDIMRTIKPGMPHSQLGGRHRMVMVGGELITVIVTRMNLKRSLRIETPMVTPPRNMRQGRMKRGKEPGAQVLEGKDIAEGTEV